MLTSKIKTELENLGIKPKKSLGQNFLINEGIYKKIVAALEIKKSDTIIEVGPGLGTLTEFLAPTGTEIIAIEKDAHLANHLKTKFANEKHVKIIEGDILKFNPHNWKLEIGNWKLLGNIPYYLTSHLLRIIFEKWPQPKLVVLMLQKEVAQRIAAKPPHMSLLAVLVQYYSQPKIISYVSHGSFYPMPEVDSAIIKLVPGGLGRLAANAETTKFFKIVQAGFTGKRKQLGNNLARGLKLNKEIIEEKLKSIGIESTRRAETLTLDEWQNIATTLLPH